MMRVSRPRDESFDRRIVMACVELLAEGGRSGLSRARIAQRAGVSLPAVNRRYGSTDEILLALVQQPGIVVADDAPAVDSLRSYLMAHLQRIGKGLADPGAARAVSEILAAAAGDSTLGAAFRRTVADQRMDGLRWVEHARRSGEIAHATDGDLILDLTIGAAYYRLLWRGELLTEAEIQAVVDQVLPTPP